MNRKMWRNLGENVGWFRIGVKVKARDKYVTKAYWFEWPILFVSIKELPTSNSLLMYDLKLMNHDINNVGWPQSLPPGKIYWEKIWEKINNGRNYWKKYWEKVNIDKID